MKKVFTIVLATIWVTAIILSTYIWGIYENTPGQLQNPSQKWPSQSLINRTNHFNLVVFFHPHCSCSLASAEAVDIIRSRCQNNLNITAVFYRPQKFKRNWEKTELFAKLSNMPQINIYIDIDGKEASFFGAAISGSTFLYDQSGALKFYGGITISRGHFDSGDNMGVKTIISYVHHQNLLATTTPVFGCSIFED